MEDATMELINGNELMEIRERLINKLHHNKKVSFLDIEEIEDAVSDAVAAYLIHQRDQESRDEFSSKEKVEAWLYTIAMNKLKNIQKEHSTKILNLREYSDKIAKSFNELRWEVIVPNFWNIVYKYGTWDVIELAILQKHYTEGIELKIIAEELGITANAIYIKNYRLLEKIRLLMKKKNIHNLKDLDF